MPFAYVDRVTSDKAIYRSFWWLPGGMLAATAVSEEVPGQVVL